MLIKDLLREILISCNIDISKNIKYDRLTRAIMKRHIKENFNCIDVGCHKGEMLDIILKYAPKGNHMAFEPIPFLYDQLVQKYVGRAEILPYALFDSNGHTTFNVVKNALAYSGIKKRKYDIANPEIEKINVELKKLDNLVDATKPINFIKIDVEGGEFGVLKGAKNILQQNKPIILFEFGLGASDFYGTSVKDMHDYLVNEIGLSIYTLQDFLRKAQPLSLNQFSQAYKQNKEYYFLAAPNQ